MSVLSPEAQRRRDVVRVIAAIAVMVLLLLGYVAYVYVTQPAGRTGPAGRASPNEAARADAGLGTGMATPEFATAFAKQLRDELDRKAREVERRERERGEEQLRVLREAIARNEAVLAELARQRAAAVSEQPSAPAAAVEEFAIGGGAIAGADTIGPGSAIVVDSTRGIATTQPLGAPADGAPGASSTTKPQIPPNGFIRGTLLNGVVATVGEPATTALVRLEGQMTSANGFSVALDGCMLSIEATPRLAAGRIDGKPVRLTCNFEDGRTQTWDVSGWVNDGNDGMRGMRATIVSSEAEKIALLGTAGAVDAAGRAVQAQQFTSSVSGGGVVTSFTGDVGRAVAGGALAGAGGALSQEIKDYFDLFAPSLQTGARTRVDVVLANPLDVPAEGAYVTSTFTRETRR